MSFSSFDRTYHLFGPYSWEVQDAALRLDKSIRIAGEAKVTAMLDVYNVTNSNAVTNFFLTSGATFNRIIAAFNPRTLQLGLRVTF